MVFFNIIYMFMYAHIAIEIFYLGSPDVCCHRSSALMERGIRTFSQLEDLLTSDRRQLMVGLQQISKSAYPS